MKKFVLSTLLSFCVLLVSADNNNKKSNSTPTINTSDTIVIDLANETMVGNKITFPVFISSDDTIYSLDFSFKYDQTLFDYDTILNLSASLQSNCYYNAADSTVRYTSFSLDTIPKNVNVVSVELTTLSGYMCNQDIYSIKGFLNGDVCSIKIMNCLSASLDANEQSYPISIFPNPASEQVTLVSSYTATAVIMDLNGKILQQPTILSYDEKLTINTNAFANGVYVVKIYNDHFVSLKKLIINK